MSASWMRILGLMITSSWLFVGCSSAKKIDVGGACVLNSDCNQGLVCTWGKCHVACRTSADCQPGQSCIIASDQSTVCESPTGCIYNSNCPTGLICAVDQQCRKQCQTDADCTSGQTCTSTQTCAELSQVDSKNNLFLPDGGVSGSGGASGAGGAGGSISPNPDASPDLPADVPGSTGGASSTGGTDGSGGAQGTGGSTSPNLDASVDLPADIPGSAGGITSAGGTTGSGGATGTGGAATGGTGGSTTPTGKIFSQCRFHFGTTDSQAKTAGASMISQLDFFTPGWMTGTFSQGTVCTDTAPGGSLAGLVPMDVADISANYVKNQDQLCDCNVSGCSGGDLCTYGAQYITQDWASILADYTSNSTGFAACLRGSPIIFEMEPGWYQYTGSGQSKPWSVAQAGTNMIALVNALKSSLPNAIFSMDISPEIANNGANWYSSFDMSLFTFINTSGGGTAANNTKIRSSNAMTWAGVHQVTGKPILADTGYGANGGSAGHDTAWDVAANINARIADGVVSIAQYNPNSSWGSTISSIRSQLNTPSVCP